MIGVLDLLEDLLSPESRPKSPNTRPAECRARTSESPQSPQSPDDDLVLESYRKSHGEVNSDAERRRARVLVLLAEHPNWQRVVVTEAGDPVILGVGVRGVTYGEIEIPAANYDAVALMALLEEHGGTIQ